MIALPLAHLMVRTAQVRELFGEGVSALTSKAIKKFGDDESFRQFLGIGKYNRSQIVHDQIEKIYERNKLLFHIRGINFESFDELASHIIEQNFSQYAESFREALHKTISELSDSLPDKIRAKHGELLLEDPAPNAWAMRLREFLWTKVVSQTESIVLPDCIASGIDGGGYSKPLFALNHDTTSEIIFPISKRSVIFGSKGSVSDISIKSVNSNLAVSSESFFLSSQNNKELWRLSKKIGQSSSKLVDEAVNKAISSLFAQVVSSS